MIAIRLFWAALREIFDESAYDRFLCTHQLARSRQSYAKFLEGTQAALLLTGAIFATPFLNANRATLALCGG